LGVDYKHVVAVERVHQQECAMRLIASVIAAALLAFSVGVLAGQSPQTDLSKLRPNSEPITLRFENAQLANVLSFLSKASGIQIGVTPDVTLPTDPINVNFSNAKFVDVFKLLVTGANLSYNVIDEKTVLITKKS
jgi:type II secretory pathway component GspD/PulD (secretin)